MPYDDGQFASLVLPLPEGLDGRAEKLPLDVAGVLSTLAVHNASGIAELASLIPDNLPVDPLSADRVTLPRPKEAAYDGYFFVERATDRTGLRFALAFLRALRAAALNADLGHDLHPAEVADFLKSIRVAAALLISTDEVAPANTDGVWPKGKRLNGPW